MKVVRSHFLDELHADWQRLLADRSTRRRTGMEAFHEKLRTLRFLDPACGCGNFLVLAYRELRAERRQKSERGVAVRRLAA
jgi:hypothetical protein